MARNVQFRCDISHNCFHPIIGIEKYTIVLDDREAVLTYLVDFRILTDFLGET